MPDTFFFDLSDGDRREILLIAADQTGRDSNTLEKDIWVVWLLNVLFTSSIGQHLSFKGGTSLSKVYKAINRFSEDIDLTYDVRSMVPEAAEHDGIPPTSSRSRKWTDTVREKLPTWIAEEVTPLVTRAMGAAQIKAELRQGEKERLYVDYNPGLFGGHDYVKSQVMLEFGARSTGEPAEIHHITCDAAGIVEGVSFPEAHPRTMKVERTFWEKATAAHVFCLQGTLKGERFARHWHDLAALETAGYADSALADRDLAVKVATHKSFFFREKDKDGSVISYEEAVSGNLVLVPPLASLKVLREDYEQMMSSGMLYGNSLQFDEIMEICRALEQRANSARG